MQRLFFMATLVLAFAGCNSYRVVQKNVFSDEDGNIVTIDYGVAEKDHVNTFVAPMTGEELDFKSKLLILAELPDGETFKAWQCMNFQPRGTMYQTDNEKWKVLVNGFSCIVYAQDKANSRSYNTVYRGVLCDSPKIDVKKDDRWKTVKPGSRGMRQNSK
jgi:hypothetical protein